jgi:hypothetical protein
MVSALHQLIPVAMLSKWPFVIRLGDDNRHVAGQHGN